MNTVLKVLAWVGKLAGLLTAVDVTGITPKWGPVIFFVASLLKDTVNRIGDFLDDGKANDSWKA